MFYLLELPNFASIEVWVALLTLTFLEIVLGVDNIVFISIASNKLPVEQRPRARRLGLIMAMLFRVLMLLGISALIKMQNPLFHFEMSWFNGAFTGQSIILLLGGLFLIYKATDEIHHKLERSDTNGGHGVTAAKATMTGVVTQIALMDIVFSFDSVLTAVGLADNVLVMIIAIVVAILVMMVFADPVSDFVNRHPTVQMLGLSFLLLIGFMLIAEGAHLGHFVIAGQEIGSMPKGYLYFAIAFSLFVEFLNMRLRKPSATPVKLKGIAETARKEGITDENPGHD